MLKVGIVGFPNAGKSTLFNALLKRQVAGTAPYPFCTIEPNKGVVPVPDERLSVLAKIVQTENIVPAVVEFVDIAGLVKGAHKGEGLGNQFLAHIKEADLIFFLLRGFETEKVDRAGSISPEDDLRSLKQELMLKDLDTLQKQKQPRGNLSKQEAQKWQTINKALSLLDGEKYLFEHMSAEEKEFLHDMFLLTLKDYIVGLNVAEADLSKSEQIKKKYKDLEPIIISAKTEEELAGMEESEQKEYLSFLKVDKSGLEQVIKTAYDRLGLISFLTAGVKEVRAWTIKKGTTAKYASGVIHTDFIAKFIKAKIVSYMDFISKQGWKNSALAGSVRNEGKDYVMQEGDIVEFMIGK